MPRIAFVAHFVICLAIACLSHARAEDGPAACSTLAASQQEVTAHGGGKLTPTE